MSSTSAVRPAVPWRRPLIPFVEPPMGAHSEAGVLRTVIADAGRGGGDPVIDALKARGVRVLQLVDLLADVLTVPGARGPLLARQPSLEAASPAVARRMLSVLEDAPPASAARMLLDGIPARDRDRDARNPDRARYLLSPLPPSRSMRQPVLAVGS